MKLWGGPKPLDCIRESLAARVNASSSGGCTSFTKIGPRSMPKPDG